MKSLPVSSLSCYEHQCLTCSLLLISVGLAFVPQKIIPSPSTCASPSSFLLMSLKEYHPLSILYLVHMCSLYLIHLFIRLIVYNQTSRTKPFHSPAPSSLLVPTVFPSEPGVFFKGLCGLHLLFHSLLSPHQALPVIPMQRLTGCQIQWTCMDLVGFTSP